MFKVNAFIITFKLIAFNPSVESRRGAEAATQ
jgi:hypothetical protein